MGARHSGNVVCGISIIIVYYEQGRTNKTR